MRKVKFRGKRLDNNKWYYGSYVHIYGTDYDWTGKPIGKARGMHYIESKDCVNLAVDKETIGQYIGLEDENGKSIYEWDIVKVEDTYEEDRPPFVGVVTFRDCSFIIKTDCTSNYRWMDYEVEVIGNIFDNKDLLEEYDLNLEYIRTEI